MSLRAIRKLIRILRQFISRRQIDRDMGEELESFIAASANEGIRRGLTPEQAQQIARSQAGPIYRVKESIRDVRSEFMFDALWQDVRHGVRILRKNRGFAFTAVVSVAIGIACSTVVFVFANAMLYEAPALIKEPDRVVGLWLGQRTKPDHRFDIQLSNPQFEALRSVQDVFDDMALYSRTTVVANVGDVTEPMNIEMVSGNHFSMLGVMPAIGRAIGPEDDKPGASGAAMISYDFWQTDFGRRPEVLGRTIRIGSRDYTIIGVTPRGFSGIMIDWYEFPKVWVPFHQYASPAALMRRGTSNPVIARLKPGIDLVTAETRLNQFINVTIDPSEDYKNSHVDRPDLMSVAPIRGGRIQPWVRNRVSSLFVALMAVSILVLCASCFNVGSFLIGQASARRHEMAVRLALGATRKRVIRQIMTESLMLALMASAVGLTLTLLLSKVALRIPKLFGFVPLYSGPSLTLNVVLFALFLTFAASFVFGFLPALIASRRSPWNMLQDSSVGWIHSGLRLSPRQVLLTLQVTFAVVLAITGAIYARSLYNIVRIDPGFSPDHVWMATINLGRIPQDRREMVDRELLSAASRSPGVQSAALSWPRPSDGAMLAPRFKLPGDPDFYDMPGLMVTENYFQTLGTRLTAGRPFTDSIEDTSSAVIVNEALANKLWPGKSVIGQMTRVRLNSNEADRQVIGVVAQANCSDHLREMRPCIYLPFQALGSLSLGIVELRVSNDAKTADSFRQLAREVNPELLVYDFKTLEDHMRERIAPQRISAFATVILALVGVILSAIGCYSVFSSMVRESTRELALHMALGASSNNLLLRVMLRAGTLCVIGVAAGSIIGLQVMRRLQDQLFNVNVGDAGLLLGVGLSLVIVAGVASFLPARSIAKTDPGAVLKVI
jgi:putative ABC transport system permease protein